MLTVVLTILDALEGLETRSVEDAKWLSRSHGSHCKKRLDWCLGSSQSQGTNDIAELSGGKEE